MKSEKVKKVKVKKIKKDSSFLSMLLIICLIASVGLFIYLAYEFQSANSKEEAGRKDIDNQIETIGRLPDAARSLSKGDLKSASEVSKTVNSFVNGINAKKKVDEDNAKSLGVKLDDATETTYSELESNVSILKFYTSPLVDNSKIITAILDLDKQIQSLSDKLTENADATMSDISKFSGNDIIKDSVTNIDKTTNQIRSNVHSFVLGSLSYEDLSRNIEEAIPFYNENIEKLNKALKASGQSAFFSGKGVVTVNDMISNAKGLIELLGAFNVNGSNFEELMSNVSGIGSQVGDITSQLYQLKNLSYAKKRTPFNLPAYFDYIKVLGAIGLLIIMLLVVIFLIHRKKMQKLNMEANKLKDIADERSKNDQEAILRLMDELSDLSDGDLTVEAQVTEDFTGAIADSVNFAIESMRGMVQTITKTSDQIQTVTDNVGRISRNLEDSSKEQSKQVTFSYETALRMSESLNNVAQNTDSSVDIARSSVDIAQEGREKVRMTIESMNGIRGNIHETSKHIKKLGESSQEIGDIIEIIKGIADQTNILSLNAAIQATTAGEAGRGFAVVADEIQRLAERSANASKRIEILVKTIQADANEATASMETSTRHVVTGAEIAEEAGNSLDKIEKVSKNLADLIVNVSKSTRTSADMAKGVSTTMNNLANINEKAANNVKESVGFIDNLKLLSGELKDSVTGFKLPTN